MPPAAPGQSPKGAGSSEFDEAEARYPRHLRTWVVLVDGAEQQLDLIRAEAARRAVTIRIVIDLIHVMEYIWGAGWSLHEAGDPAAEDRVAARALAVLAGDSSRVSQEITAEADAAGLPGSQRNGAAACGFRSEGPRSPRAVLILPGNMRQFRRRGPFVVHASRPVSAAAIPASRDPGRRDHL